MMYYFDVSSCPANYITHHGAGIQLLTYPQAAGG